MPLCLRSAITHRTKRRTIVERIGIDITNRFWNINTAERGAASERAAVDDIEFRIVGKGNTTERSTIAKDIICHFDDGRGKEDVCQRRTSFESGTHGFQIIGKRYVCKFFTVRGKIRRKDFGAGGKFDGD